jgi:outer membrane lipopolysaccharide assembly protein LptE/RlpB
MRRLALALIAVALCSLSGCGYHALGAATHLPPGVRTLAVPVFKTQTEAYRSETVMTQAVIREFATRTRMRVTPDASTDADAVLHGTILKEIVAPLTYNTTTQQSSSFLITMIVSVTLTDRDGKVLYENKNYVFRQQYQSTTDLPSFFQENPAAVERLSREFARQLVADVLEGF